MLFIWEELQKYTSQLFLSSFIKFWLQNHRNCPIRQKALTPSLCIFSRIIQTVLLFPGFYWKLTIIYKTVSERFYCFCLAGVTGGPSPTWGPEMPPWQQTVRSSPSVPSQRTEFVSTPPALSSSLTETLSWLTYHQSIFSHPNGDSFSLSRPNGTLAEYGINFCQCSTF